MDSLQWFLVIKRTFDTNFILLNEGNLPSPNCLALAQVTFFFSKFNLLEGFLTRSSLGKLQFLYNTNIQNQDHDANSQANTAYIIHKKYMN